MTTTLVFARELFFPDQHDEYCEERNYTDAGNYYVVDWDSD